MSRKRIKVSFWKDSGFSEISVIDAHSREFTKRLPYEDNQDIYGFEAKEWKLCNWNYISFNVCLLLERQKKL